MDIKIIENKKDSLRVEIHGTDHAMMNLLRGKLESGKEVDFSTYSEPHPLLDGFVVTVKGKDSEASFKKALAELKADAKEISAAFKKAK
jgi:DNA-directed RNA polymerase subunit L